MTTRPSASGWIISKPKACGLLLLLLVATSSLFAPRSEANLSSTLQGQDDPINQKPRRHEFVPGEVLVRFKHGRAFEGRAIIAATSPDAGAPRKTNSLAAPIEEIPIELNRFAGSDLVDGLRLARTAPDDTLKTIAALKARDDVLYAEPNYLVHPDANPNDPFFNPPPGQLYGLGKIGAPQAWDTTTGSRGIVVGVVDEGIDITHPDLLANIWTNPAPGALAGFAPQVKLSSANYNVAEGAGRVTVTVTSDQGDLHGYDFITNTGLIPAEGHGTHVAGTIGAVGNNGIGVVGVNWQTSLMSLRFINQLTNNGNDADAIRAYNYAKQMRDLWISTGGTQGANIRVLNNSYGGGGFSQAAADAISALNQSGILFIASAGNNGNLDNDLNPQYPAGYSLPNVISVAATDSVDGLAGFSHFGARTVRLGAPGVGIQSTLPSTYGPLSGTSMAAPHVTGAAALLLAQDQTLTVNKLRALLEFNGDQVASLAGKTVTGRRLNVSNSMQALLENDTTPPGTVTGFQITSQTGRTVSLSWVSSGDDLANPPAAALYDLSFTDGSTNAVIPLTTLIPTAPGVAQNVTVKIPYRHTAGTIRLREFDNVGNEGVPATVSVNVDPLVADPYIPTTAAPAALSAGGTGLAFNCDDCFRSSTLPFSFPFFGSSSNTVKISSNGNIYFEPPTAPTRQNGEANDVPSSVTGMSAFRMISGMWDDLDLRTSRRAGADVYVVQSIPGSQVIFRWQGVQFGDGTNGSQVNFEIELNSNGVIKTRYGAGNTNLFPVVGISGGEPDVYSISSLTSELSPLSLTNASSAVFTPRSLGPIAPPEAPSISAGIPAPGPATVDSSQMGAATVTPQAGNVTVAFATSDAAGGQDCSVANGKASARCDYMISFGTLTFATGETTKTISIPIVDDSFVEGTETFTVSLSNVSGAPLGSQTSATVTVTDNDSPGGSNPLDGTAFFVRQNYLDFLNREPDTAGLNFWSNNINNCSPQPACIETQRVNTSTAFFLSIEFQETGYLVERIYKSAFGDAQATSTFGTSPTPHALLVPVVRFAEFLPDTQQIGTGVVVGQGNWQQQLDDNKNAFTAAFVQRPGFIAQFPINMAPGDFVDKLNLNAGSPLSFAERNQLVADLTGSTKTRAQVLRAVAEDPDLKAAEFNRAFVLMQYFGYLRRNPNDPQDTDYTGYEFWLVKLNTFTQPGDDPLVRAQKADMVKAFITAGEYRQRFGP